MFRLAAHFRILDPNELLDRWPRRLLIYWLTYFQLEPTLADRVDVLLPKLAGDLINLLRDPESPPVTFSDMRIDWAGDPEPPAEYSAQIATAESAMADTILAAFG